MIEKGGMPEPSHKSYSGEPEHFPSEINPYDACDARTKVDINVIIPVYSGSAGCRLMYIYNTHATSIFPIPQ